MAASKEGLLAKAEYLTYIRVPYTAVDEYGNSTAVNYRNFPGLLIAGAVGILVVLLLVPCILLCLGLVCGNDKEFVLSEMPSAMAGSVPVAWIAMMFSVMEYTRLFKKSLDIDRIDELSQV